MAMFKYQVRCECAWDFEIFAKHAKIGILDFKFVEPPEDADDATKFVMRASPEFKFKSTKSLKELLEIAYSLDSGGGGKETLHVLYETLQLEENYTGDRIGYREELSDFVGPHWDEWREEHIQNLARLRQLARRAAVPE